MEPIDYETILRSDRWKKLAEGFREVEALLLVLVPARASGLDALIESMDGAIVVGDERRSVPGRVLGTVRPAAEMAASRPGAGIGDDDLANVFGGERRRRTALFVIGAALVIAAIAAILWATGAISAPREEPAAPQAALPDSAGTSDSASGAAAAPPLPVAADSASAMLYAVELFKYSSMTEANSEVDGAVASGIPAVTYAPLFVGVDSARWFSLIAGAYRRRTEAETLLASLRSRGFLPVDRGSVVRVPFAVLVQRGVTAENARALVNAYHVRGLPVYSLRQDDGTATLYAGAFARPEDATPLLGTFRASGEQPTVVYRTGRLF
jgi:hypothetical protein